MSVDSLSLALMVWISAYSGLPVPDTLPRIVLKTSCELHTMVKIECLEDKQVVALSFGDTVYLEEGWEPNTPYNLAILVHELVHVMQFHADIPRLPCFLEAWEKPAYEIHFAFLESMKLDPFKETGIDAFTLKLNTTCQ